jgi:hypothetical protein
MEADIVAIDNNQETGTQRVYVCEVVTHMKNGGLYSGSPDPGGWWMEFSNTKAYQYSLQKLWDKFREDYRYVDSTFPHADEYRFQFWAPKVSGRTTNGPLIRGLETLAEKFKEETGEKLELIINTDYTAHIDKLQREARGDVSDHGSPGFRILQILENLVEE